MIKTQIDNRNDGFNQILDYILHNPLKFVEKDDGLMNQ